MPRTRPEKMIPNDEDSTDLRRQRSVTTRRKIAAALLELLGEGVVQPTAEQVAARADVGLRTVFRHFEDMEMLYREVIPAFDALIEPVVQRRAVATTGEGRLLESIDVLSAHYERLAIYYVATQASRHRSAYLDEQLRRYASLQREMLRGVLPAPLGDDKPCFNALSLLLSMDAWVHLRREQGLGVAAAVQALKRAALALVRSSPAFVSAGP